ncbi:MAG: hypothetical protein AYL33_007940 [Candidatus Bathyarchaeota archaeon B63]|nr:MAG: hypothetical protein AYL33_007940 [Candidatus Bathyarchaeota archaeon B63]
MRRKGISIEVSLFAHATEDPQKVESAFRNILPSSRRDEVTLRKRVLKGEYGNPIVYYKAKITKMEIAEAILRKMACNLSTLDKEMLEGDLERRVEKGSLYIRLDKQAAYLGKFRLCNSDPIHLKVRFKTPKINSIRSICRDLGMLP